MPGRAAAMAVNEARTGPQKKMIRATYDMRLCCLKCKVTLNKLRSVVPCHA